MDIRPSPQQAHTALPWRASPTSLFPSPNCVFPLPLSSTPGYLKASRAAEPRAKSCLCPDPATSQGHSAGGGTEQVICGGTPRVPKPSHLPGHGAQQFPSLWGQWGRSSLQLPSQLTAAVQGVTHLLEPVSTTGKTMSPCPCPSCTTPPQRSSLSAAAMASWEQHEDTPRYLKAGPGKPQEESPLLSAGTWPRDSYSW